ncbi:winged helix-turn-helix domain-containing protein [Nakamurella flava]|nr:crosslink repair DNA glycosylase YcaQ family protein [Nakamurella flava]
MTSPKSAVPPPAGPSLTIAQARRIAIAAQGLHRPPASTGGSVTAAALVKLVRRLGLLQIDSVNVLARAHLMPVFSRLGSYDTALLDRVAWPATSRGERHRALVETWAHEASLVPVETMPLLRWKQQQLATRWERHARRLRAQHPGVIEEIVDIVRDLGPRSAGEIEAELQERAHQPRRGQAGWWEWSATKQACEFLFGTGVFAVARRRGFERLYDLSERVLPPEIIATPTLDPADAHRALVAHAATAFGIATATDLADYFRLPVAGARRAVAELVEAGELQPVAVDGWREPAYRHRDARLPRAVDGAALVSPFDPLVWFRPRDERLLDFHYRIEIYTPAAKRVHGYYVLPLLIGDRIVGRFDLKADRATGRLLVPAAWREPGVPTGPDLTVRAAGVLRSLADWLGLGEIVVAETGTWAQDLRGVLGGPAR